MLWKFAEFIVHVHAGGNTVAYRTVSRTTVGQVTLYPHCRRLSAMMDISHVELERRQSASRSGGRVMETMTVEIMKMKKIVILLVLIQVSSHVL